MKGDCGEHRAGLKEQQGVRTQAGSLSPLAEPHLGHQQFNVILSYIAFEAGQSNVKLCPPQKKRSV